ncbi:probable CCR4-associated factor 1 homolog 9 [Andrographis paniculata]|uniref:probable CCR4-associated factor 1 homolog 9 n=1 Tax=Andrographis paniculata TaxID=175694 RepID=UPI0021E7494E|nr:probable CCR4-associated factor 1 homolog 9 [Andrographis paniculata]
MYSPFLRRRPSAVKAPVVVRQVWSANLDYEFSLIREIVDRYPYISMDTEFPGVVFSHNHHSSNPGDHYRALKSNVDALKLIQVGLTLSDAAGNLPDLGTGGGRRFIWEFNFSDFDETVDPHAASSIDLLRHQGFDFGASRRHGAAVSRFAELMMSSGLVCNDSVTYVTFHGGYDFGYLVKALIGKSLPDSIEEFKELMRILFGENVYDVKHLMRACPGLHGGLERISQRLGIGRVAGKSHQAGSDSLLTWHAFEKIKDNYFAEKAEESKNNDKVNVLEQFAGVLHGLGTP